jgi:hypothetical protein
LAIKLKYLSFYNNINNESDKKYELSKIKIKGGIKNE